PLLHSTERFKRASLSIFKLGRPSALIPKLPTLGSEGVQLFLGEQVLGAAGLRPARRFAFAGSARLLQHPVVQRLPDARRTQLPRLPDRCSQRHSGPRSTCPRVDRDGAGAASSTLAGTSAADDRGTKASTHSERDSVATATSPDPRRAHARGSSRTGAPKRGRSPSVQANHS